MRDVTHPEVGRTIVTENTWCGQRGVLTEYLLGGKSSGERVTVHRWLEDGRNGSAGDVRVRRVNGDGRSGDKFVCRSDVTLHGASQGDVDAAVTRAIDSVPGSDD